MTNNQKRGLSSDQEELLRKKIRCQENGEQTIELARQEIERICNVIQVDNRVSHLANAIYRRSLEKKFIENRTIGTVAAAAVYAACRIENEPRSADKVSGVATETIADRARDVTILKRVYSEMSTALELRTGPVDPKALIPRFVDQLNLNSECEAKAKELLDTVDETVKSGKSPRSLAAAAVYCSSLLHNEMRTQEQVAEVADLSETTIRERYQEMIYEVGVMDEED
ncbi:transcription factor TFIIB cyclin-related protein [Halobellus rubicundus]|uniref:Transcription factor TFIIB cyclin-related protein n=1 Tax=Halobellus rubicundus TaxID=2996466 RepID=A0ABD5MGP8_9EURY